MVSADCELTWLHGFRQETAMNINLTRNADLLLKIPDSKRARE
jgi:hypothetical protein